jgi:hypothetical protein
MELKREDFPEDFDELKKVKVELPLAKGETEATCPIPMLEILKHLAHECPGGEFSGSEETIDFRLNFSRTAIVNETKYWLWLFEDIEGSDSFVLVGKGPNELLVYDETFGLSSEQIIIAQHFDID